MRQQSCCPVHRCPRLKNLVIVLCCQSSHSIIFALMSLNTCIMSIFECCCKNRIPPTTEFALFSQQEYRFEQGDNSVFNVSEYNTLHKERTHLCKFPSLYRGYLACTFPCGSDSGEVVFVRTLLAGRKSSNMFDTRWTLPIVLWNTASKTLGRKEQMKLGSPNYYRNGL